MFRSRKLFTVLALATAGLFVMGATTDADPVALLQQQVKTLSARLTALEREVKALKIAPAVAQVTPQMESAAAAALAPIEQMLAAGKMEQAKPQLAKFLQDHPASTRAGRRAGALNREVQVVGRAAPPDWKLQKWYQGEADINLQGDAPTILVFWETWCPHCRREVPKLQALYDRYREQGLQILGLTQVNRSATEELVLSFIADNKLGYPMAKEDGTLSRHFGVRGIPAVAVVKGGKVVWRGHPAKVNDTLVASWF